MSRRSTKKNAKPELKASPPQATGQTEADALRKAEETYHELVENINDVVYATDKNGIITYISPIIEAVLGYGPKEVIGRHYSEFLHPDDLPPITELFEKVLAGHIEPTEYRMLTKAGETRWVRTSSRAIKGSNGRIELRGVLTDITERKRAEEALRESHAKLERRVEERTAELARMNRRLRREMKERTKAGEAMRESKEKYRLLVDHANDAIFITQDDSIRFPNPKTEELFGLSAVQLASSVFTDLVYSEDREIVIDRHKRRLAGRSVPGIYSIRIAKGNGEVLWVEVNDVKIMWEERPAILNFLRDITPQKKLEAQLQQAQKMEALGTLVAGIAHEINNPINLMIFNVTLLERIWRDFQPLLDENGHKEPNKKYGGLSYIFLKDNLTQMLSDMNMAANRMARIGTSLKEFARRSKITDRAAMSVNTAVEQAVRLVQTTIRKSGVKLKVHLGEDLPLMEGNIQAIEQIVLNLVINAVQAIDHDLGRVELATRYRAKDRQLYISISDNGCGIDPSVSETLFDPFVTSKRAEGGTGLGLAVTYNIVKAHGGEIHVTSKQGKGSTFVVSFPTRTKEKIAKVLVVDDDDAIREALAEALTTDRPYLVEAAKNGVEACIKLGTYRPDLLILDIFMPQMNGLEVCQAIKAESKLSKTKVILVTGFPKHPMLHEIAKLGFRNVCAKPFNLYEFVRRIDEILETPGSRMEESHEIAA